MGAGGEKRRRGRYVALSEGERSRFLEVLSQTGNRKAAAEAIGIEPRLMDQRRRYDALLDRQWTEAVEIAHRRLSGASGPFDCIGGALNVIKRGPGGRLQMAASGQKRWCKAVEDRFIAALSACGNIAAAARAIGFSQSSVDQRRRKWSGFEARLQQALEDAELAIEFRLASEAGAWDGPEGAGAGAGEEQRPSTSLGANGTPAGVPTPQPCGPHSGPSGGRSMGPHPASRTAAFDREFGLRFLKWREEKRRGGGRRDHRRVKPPRSVEDVTESVLKKAEAIIRHRKKSGRPGPSGEP